MAWLLLILLCLGSSRANFLNITSKIGPGLEERLLSLLLTLQTEKLYDTLLIYGRDCAFPSLSSRLQVPTVLVSSSSTNFEWNFSSLTLILSCEFQAEMEENYRTLMKLQVARRLLLLRGDLQPESVCDFYSKKEQYNIAMVKENFDHFGVVYSCRLFQDRNYEEVILSDVNQIFVEQFRNMHGAPIRTITDNLEPRSMGSQDPKTGKKKWIGFVANLINNFIEKVNATMDMPEELTGVDGKVFFVNISQWTANDLLDIGMTVDSTWEMTNFDTFSYPYLTSSYCLMLPLPDLVPHHEIYGVIIDHGVLVVLLVLFLIFSMLLIYIQQKSFRGLRLTRVLMNDMCLRGFLAQPFPFPRQSSRKLKLICLLLCFSSLMTTTMYGAYLHTFLYSPPAEPMVRTISDFEKSRYKVAMNWAEIDMLRSEKHRKLHRVSDDRIHTFEDFHKFENLRGSFDSDFVFPVTSVRWSTYNEQQKLFQHPVFYYSDDFCLSRYSILSFPIRRHLPYRETFEDHILRQKEFGLLNHWIDHSFLDMLRLDLTKRTDFSKPLEDQRKICVDDLYWVLGLYALALGISGCCFALELLRSLNYWARFKEYKWR
ncbi:uncharacterized protein LOC119549580 [Drosophila subpulchrella]|uniref:uncharacterized protein LOC119549580 n=1 Tax=Drosophila subpulchrella TaxID=1486046 RepID=UPI0018A1776F|nr:uncharacterized protein LOC119549580 [Drosophila subpulchrella]